MQTQPQYLQESPRRRLRERELFLGFPLDDETASHCERVAQLYRDSLTEPWMARVLRPLDREDLCLRARFLGPCGEESLPGFILRCEELFKSVSGGALWLGQPTLSVDELPYRVSLKTRPVNQGLPWLERLLDFSEILARRMGVRGIQRLDFPVVDLFQISLRALPGWLNSPLRVSPKEVRIAAVTLYERVEQPNRASRVIPLANFPLRTH